MKIYDVIISDAAYAMLDAHIDFLARVSKPAATKLMDGILDRIDSLKENPERYPFYENPFTAASRYRKIICSKRYMVLYEISDDTVYADYILDCRQDSELLLG